MDRAGIVARGGARLEQAPRKGDRPRCGARCRSKGGAPCSAPVVVRRELDVCCHPHVLVFAKRCRLHGGLATGPRTAEGRRRCAEAGRKGAAERWRRWRESLASGGSEPRARLEELEAVIASSGSKRAAQSPPADPVPEQPPQAKAEPRTLNYSELSPAEQMAYRAGATFCGVQVIGGPPRGGNVGSQQ